MTQARYTLTFPDNSHDAALAFTEVLEADVRFDAMALTINETDEARNHWEVLAYFEHEEDAAAMHAAYLPKPSIVSKIIQQDWVRKSLQGLAPVTAGRFFLYGNHDRDKCRAGGISLEIDAGTAFGTGHHGTTEGCLAALDEILKRNRPRRILDLGCGTGVLGIAAARATRHVVLATDIDPEAVRVTLLNARNNHAASHIKAATAPGLKHTTIAAHAPYDLILANILARPLAILAKGLSEALQPGGHVILSGLTLDQMRWIKACYRNQNLIFINALKRENWATLVYQKAP